jgi:hypothetical protein
MAADRLVQRDIKVVEPRQATMILCEPGKHVLVAVGVEDAIQDSVIVLIQGVACYLVYEPYVDSAEDVLLLEDYPADEVLRDPGNASPAVGLAKRLRDRALARSRVPPQDNKPRSL